MKVLVTGGAGYKGIKLVKKLLDEGMKVTILDNFMYGFEPVLHLVEHENLDIIKDDIRNKISNLNEFDAVYHLAGLSGFPACSANPSSAYLINVEATKQLVNDLSKEQLLIYASTTSFYGKSGLPCDEETPVDPVSHYGKTKYEAEKIIMQRENSIALRFATIFGLSPKMRMDLMINDFTYKAVKEGVVVLFDSYAKRTFMHIDDAVSCYYFALNNRDKMTGKVFNAGGNHLNYSKLEIAQNINKFKALTIIESQVKDKDVRHFIISFDKIYKYGFKPAKTIEDGIKEMLRVFEYYDYFSHYKTI